MSPWWSIGKADGQGQGQRWSWCPCITCSQTQHLRGTWGKPQGRGCIRQGSKGEQAVQPCHHSSLGLQAKLIFHVFFIPLPVLWITVSFPASPSLLRTPCLHDVFFKRWKKIKVCCLQMFWDIPCIALPLPSPLGKAHGTAEAKMCDVFLDLYVNIFILTGRNNFKIPGKQLKEKKNKLDMQ